MNEEQQAQVLRNVEICANIAASKHTLFVRFEPGDMTRYELVLTPPPTRLYFVDGQLVAPPDPRPSRWYVSRVGGSVDGACDEWDPTVEMNPWTAMERWGNQNEWSGTVIATFLNAFARAIGALL